MIRRARLRWKIMMFTVPPLVTLAIATLWTVNRSITHQADLSIHEDLRRAAAVFESMLAARSNQLEVAGAVIVRDPRFFSALALPGSWKDEQFRATVSGVARDFNTITQADLFEVLDAAGHRVCAVGEAASGDQARGLLVGDALAGRVIHGLLAEPHALYQVNVTPVIVGGRVTGALLLGASVGRELADQLRSMTRSEVTFLSRSLITGSTLEAASEDQAAILTALEGFERGDRLLTARGAILEVHARGRTSLTLVASMPPSLPEDRQYYVMQRSLDAETAFLRDMQTRLVGLGLVAVLLTLVAGALIAERIVAPVRRLVRGAEEMERGNYDYPLLVRSRDEIGYLAERFQEMRQRQRVHVAGLEEMARLRSEFIAVASHELRTPISIIKGFQEVMIGGGAGPISDQQRRALEAMGRSVDTLTRIAEDATRMSQIDSDRLALNLGDHDLKPLVRAAIEAAESRAPGRTVEVTAEVGPDLAAVRVDGPRLQQALTNLVGNGIRFTPDGGRVEVRARREGPDLCLSVRDTGIGIAEERREGLLGRGVALRDSLNHHSSSTLEFNSSGLGLGLPIARGIIEAHGGRIRIESEPDHGTLIEIRLPRAAQERVLEEAA